MATVLEEFLVKFGFEADTRGLDRVVSGLDAVGKLTHNIKAPFEAFNATLMAFRILGHAIIEPFEKIVELSTEAALEADKLAETASMYGVAAEDLESFSFAAEQAGSDAGDMQFALKILNKELAQAATGSAESAKTFAKYGIAIKDSSGKLKSAGEVSEEAFAKLASMTDENERSAAALDLFGRAGMGLKNFLSKTPEEIRELREEFIAFGGGASKVLQELGDEYDNSMKKRTNAVKSFQNAFAVGLQPWLNKFSKWVEDQYRKYGPQLRTAFEAMGNAIGYLGDLVGGFIDTFYQAAVAVGSFISGIVEGISKSEFLTGILEAIALRLTLAWLGPIAPIALLVIAVEDFFAFLEGKDSVIGDLWEAFQQWVDATRESSPALNAVLTFFGALAMGIGNVIELLKYLWLTFQDGGLDGLLRAWTDAVVTFGRSLMSSLMGPFEAVKNFLGLGGGGGGASVSPSAGAVGASGATAYNSTDVNAPISVYAPPGANSREIAQMTADQFKDMFKSEIRAAHPDVAYAR
jgi:hypothetical protein